MLAARSSLEGVVSERYCGVNCLLRVLSGSADTLTFHLDLWIAV